MELRLGPDGTPYADRIQAAVVGAADDLERWFGDPPFDAVVIVERRWNDRALDRSPNTIQIDVPWWVPSDDRVLERRLMAAVSRVYWSADTAFGSEAGWVRDGIASYTATRLIHERLEGRHFHVARLFGGFVPFVVRTVSLSPDRSDSRPRLADFAEAAEAPPRSVHSRRLAAALRTLERYIGWPAVQQALSTLASLGSETRLTLDALVSALHEVTGRDLSWLLEQTVDPDRSFDYAVVELRSEAVDGRYRTTVVVRRLGDAVFSGTGRDPESGFESGRGVVIDVTFEDGVAREFWDGRAERREFLFESRTPAVSAYIDPEQVMLVDVDRFNNGLRVTPGGLSVPVRLSLHWLTWLQDLMLSVAIL